MTKYATALVILLVLLEAGARPAPFPVNLKGRLYRARVDLSSVLTAKVREKLRSGLTTRFVLRASVRDVQTGEAKAVSVVEYRVLYRVWEEDFVIRRWSAEGEAIARLKRFGDVLRRLARQHGLAVAGREDLVPGRRYRVRLVVQVDPISEALLARVREYLANPGGHLRGEGGRGLFGNLARIFFDPRAESSRDAIHLRSVVFVAGPHR